MARAHLEQLLQERDQVWPFVHVFESREAFLNLLCVLLVLWVILNGCIQCNFMKEFDSIELCAIVTAIRCAPCSRSFAAIESGPFRELCTPPLDLAPSFDAG